MMTLQIYCSNHLDRGEPREHEILLDTIDETTRYKVEENLVAHGWVVQFNGENMDTYCSKKCAE